MIKLSAYALMALGAIVLVSNLFGLVRSLGESNNRSDVLVFCVLGALMIGTGLFLKGFTGQEAGTYWETVRTFCKDYKWWLIASTGLSVLGLLAVGLPGGVLMKAMDLLVDPLIAKPLGWRSAHSDSTWPAAIMYSVLTPWVAFGTYLCIKKFCSVKSTLVLSLTVTAVTLAFAFSSYVIYRKVAEKADVKESSL